jgi:hypothetical protein
MLRANLILCATELDAQLIHSALSEKKKNVARTVWVGTFMQLFDELQPPVEDRMCSLGYLQLAED